MMSGSGLHWFLLERSAETEKLSGSLEIPKLLKEKSISQAHYPKLAG